MTKNIGTVVRWMGPIAILLVHTMALGLLFLLIAMLGNAFVDHYKALGIASTPRFDIVHRISDFLSRSPIVLVAVVIADALAIRWIGKRSARWLSAYSHTCLASIVFMMFVAFSWMINPMVWNPPNPGVAAPNQVVASVR